MFNVIESDIIKVISNREIPTLKEVEILISESQHTTIDEYGVNCLVNAIYSEQFDKIKQFVLSSSKKIRKQYWSNSIVTMAPVEVSNKCVSNCMFCGWRSTNHRMVRLRISDDLLLKQIKYLISKKIYYIELVGGDDFRFVKTLPSLVTKVRRLFPHNVKGRIFICTMPLTSLQYRVLKESGSDGIIVWQECYRKEIYDKYVISGPKAFGIDDNYKIVKGGNGYQFRLNSQDRALNEGLDVSIGSMLGLNEDLNYEIIATIKHAKYLLNKYPEIGTPKRVPLIIGMPTWNNITTPKTDLRPTNIIDIESIFSYFTAVIFLALDKSRVWLFPNCRVSLETQLESLLSGGVFTSTEVKLSPGGYLKSVLDQAGTKERISIIDRLGKDLDKGQHKGVNALDYIDNLEQFCHHYHKHEEYLRAFKKEGLEVIYNR